MSGQVSAKKFMKITGPGGWLLLALIFGLVYPAAGMGSSRSENALLAQGGLARVDSLLESGQVSAAVNEAQRLYEQFETDPLYGWQVSGRLGLALLRAGEPGQALPHLESVMRRNPNDHVAHRNFAVALLQLGRKGRALSEFQVAVELAPADYEARLEYGQVLAEFGDVNAAIEQLEVARHLCPGCNEPDQVLAAACLGAGRYDEAVEPLRRLLAGGTSSRWRLPLAQALTGAGRDRELLDLLAGAAPDPLSAEELNLAVEAEGRLGEADWSLACLGTLSGQPTLPGGLPDGLLTDQAFWGRLALNLLNTDHFQKGLQAVDKAVELDPDNVINRNNRVVLLLKLDRDEEAAREWAEVLKLDPSLEAKENE